MKTISILLALLGLCQAAPDDWRIMQWDSLNNLQNRTVAHPGANPAFLIYNHSTSRPDLVILGSGLEFDTVNDRVKVADSYVSPGVAAAIAAGSPAIPTNVSAFTNDSGYITTTALTWANVTGKPSFFSGAYGDLTGKPTLFSGAYSDLSGKPTLFDGQYSSLSGIPSTFSPSAHIHSQSEVTGLVAALSGKEPSIAAGTASQYFRGDKTWQAFPTIPSNTNQLTNGAGFITQSGARASVSLTTTGTGAASYNSTTGVINVPTPAIKRQETYSGTTNASGVYTATFGTAFAAAPNIQVSLNLGTDTQTWRVTAISATGFTVLVRNRVDVVGLLPTYSNVSGATLDVLITEK